MRNYEKTVKKNKKKKKREQSNNVASFFYFLCFSLKQSIIWFHETTLVTEWVEFTLTQSEQIDLMDLYVNKGLRIQSVCDNFDQSAF